MLKNKAEIKKQVRELKEDLNHQKGRLSVLMEQQADPEICRSETRKVQTIQQTINTLQWVLGKRNQI